MNDGETRLHVWVLGSVTALALAAQHAFWLFALYLAPNAAEARGAIAALAGAAAGFYVARAFSPFAPQLLPLLLFATGIAVMLASVVPFLAFEHGTLSKMAAAACLFAVVATAAAACVAILGALARTAVALGLVSFLLRPGRLALLLAAAVLAEFVCSRSGFLRSGPLLALLLAAFAGAFPPIYVGLHGARFPHATLSRAACISVAGAAVAALVAAEQLVPGRELWRFPDEIVFAKSTASADYTVVASPGGYELFRDEELAVSSLDDARRTAALVRPVLAVAPRAARVLLLDGGFGNVEHDVLADARVARLVSVAPDPERSTLARRLSFLSARAGHALESSRLQLITAEPLVYLRRPDPERFDVVIADFPWPLGFREGKLYTHYAFSKIAGRLDDGGVVVVPGASALTAPGALADIVATLRSVGLSTLEYHVAVPTLGMTSFVVGSSEPLDAARLAQAGPGLDLGADLRPAGAGRVATLHDQTVVAAFGIGSTSSPTW